MYCSTTTTTIRIHERLTTKEEAIVLFVMLPNNYEHRTNFVRRTRTFWIVHE